MPWVSIVRIYALESAQCGMRSIEVWPLKYRRGFYARFRETGSFLEAKQHVETSLLTDLRGKLVTNEEFLSWGTRIEAIGNSCEKKSRNGHLNAAFEDLLRRARKQPRGVPPQ
jgi:hypothetical protein